MLLPHETESGVTPRDRFRPTASLDMLKLRARWLAGIRRFFDGRGYFEVDTPTLSRDCAIDANLSPFVTRWHAGGEPASDQAASSPEHELFLQTSPEFAMKRLLAAGASAIYQLGHVFRNGEVGSLHNPEFTMLEWYRVGDTHLGQMDVVEELVTTLLALPSPTRFKRTTYRAAFERQVGIDVLAAPTSELIRTAAERGIAAPPGLRPDDRDGWLNLLLALVVEATLGRGQPEFVFDYPASQAALARIRPIDPPVAERFELYLDGIEICNGYHELTDAAELRHRIEHESASRAAAGRPRLPNDSLLLAAMDAGLPPCAGVALGVDRLLQVAVGARSLAEVIPFPFDRA